MTTKARRPSAARRIARTALQALVAVPAAVAAVNAAGGHVDPRIVAYSAGTVVIVSAVHNAWDSYSEPWT